MIDFEVFARREREGWADDEVVGNYVDGFGPIVDAMVGKACSGGGAD